MLFHILALIVILLVLGCANADFFDYRAKPLLFVSWGANTGKFGLAVPAEGEIVGPRTFAVDDAGDIHTFDTVKRNVKVFSREGIF